MIQDFRKMTASASINRGSTPAGPLISTSFFYSIQGQIKSGDFPMANELYIKTCYHHGADWIFCNVSFPYNIYMVYEVLIKIIYLLTGY